MPHVFPMLHRLCAQPPPDERLSKKLENHTAAVALHYMHYNFARVHKTLRVTPLWKPDSPRTPGASRKSSGCWAELQLQTK